MAVYVTPLSDFSKAFEIYCSNKEDVDDFEENGAIWGYEPFLEYMENFDDDRYGYNVSRRIEAHLFGKGKTYRYYVDIYKIHKDE